MAFCFQFHCIFRSFKLASLNYSQPPRLTSKNCLSVFRALRLSTQRLQSSCTCTVVVPVPGLFLGRVWSRPVDGFPGGCSWRPGPARVCIFGLCSGWCWGLCRARCFARPRSAFCVCVALFASPPPVSLNSSGTVVVPLRTSCNVPVVSYSDQSGTLTGIHIKLLGGNTRTIIAYHVALLFSYTVSHGH